MNPIDVVITWVDGNDPAHVEKMEPYLKAEFGIENNITLPDFSAGATRYRSTGEIFFCVASILRFAPFVRKIFIVTDNQDPQINDFVDYNFPDKKTEIEIVNHKVIFKGYQEFLPVFSSRSIETNLFRIPDLSENFVYFNDDMFLLRKIKPEDWFVDDKAVVYGRWRPTFFIDFLKLFKPVKGGKKVFGFKDGMVNSAKVLNYKMFLSIDHTPYTMKRSVLKSFFDKNHDVYISNIHHKFRSQSQFNTQELFFLLALKSGDAIRFPKNKLLYLKPVGRGDSYVERKIKTYKENKNLIFGCVGSLDLATESDRNKVINWLMEVCNVKMV